MSELFYLVTGASRGIGLAYVEALLKGSQKAVVIAAARNVDSEGLKALSKIEGNKLVTVTLDTTSEDNALAVAKELKERYGLDRLDVFVHNAGSNLEVGPLRDISAGSMQGMYDTNATSVLRCYKAFAPLLQKSILPNGKFVYIGSSGGSIENIEKFGGGLPAAYFASKAAGHYITRALAVQDKELCISCVDPGLVLTGLGNEGFAKAGMNREEILKKNPERYGGFASPAECAEAFTFTINTIDSSNGHGRFFSAPRSLAARELVETPW